MQEFMKTLADKRRAEKREEEEAARDPARFCILSADIYMVQPGTQPPTVRSSAGPLV